MNTSDLELFPDSRSQTVHEYVLETLRRAILRGTLKGGTHLVQADLARKLGVSTTPVREALRDLATSGLVQLDAHRGAIVKQLSFSEVAEIYDLRMLLEPEGMRRAAATIGADQLARAEELQRQMGQEDDPGVWADLNRQFHGTLFESIDSPRLASLLENLRESAAPYVGLSLQDMAASKVQQANDEHAELLAAMRERDGDKAAEIALRHLQATLDSLEATHEAIAQ